MDCDVERITRRKPTKRARGVYVWRCRRPACLREFPYDAVLILAGCRAPETYRQELYRLERELNGRRPKCEPVVDRKTGKTLGLRYWR